MTQARRPDVELTLGQVGWAWEVDGSVFEDRYSQLALWVLAATVLPQFFCSAAFRSRRRPQELQYRVSCR